MSEKKRVGRKSKKIPKYIEPLFDNLRAGLTMRAAATQAGLSPATVDSWRANDENFAQLFQEAIDYSEAVLLAEIRQQGRSKDDWRASAWVLERRFPDRWALRKEIDMKVETKNDGQDMVLSMIAQATESLKTPTTIDEEEPNE